MVRKKESIVANETKPFIIPQIAKTAFDLHPKKDDFNPSRFVSPMFGKSVLDKTVVLGFNSDGDIRKKYNAFRDEKIPVPGEEDYQEFGSVLISNKTRSEIFPGAKSVVEVETKTEKINEPVPEVKLSFVKDLKEEPVSNKEDNYTAPVYGNPNAEKPMATPLKQEENVFNYGTELGDVELEKFSFPKYEEPVYTHQRPIDFEQPKETPRKSLFDSFKESEKTEEEITYQEEVTFKTPTFQGEDSFIKSGEFGLPSHEEEKESDVYEESIDEDYQEEVTFNNPMDNLHLSSQESEKSDNPSEKEGEYKHSVRQMKYENYHLPPVSLLKKKAFDKNARPEWIQEMIDIINSTLTQFDVDGEVESFTKGPTVTRYEIKLKPGVHVKKVSNISDNLKMALAAKDIRIEAPIPGKPNVGIEVPNKVPEGVAFGNIVNDPLFLSASQPLKVAVGLNIDGDNVYSDIAKMPHGLIAGTTGSGKSVCVNCFLISLLLKNSPKDLKLMLIDPKTVEMMPYNEIPHLVTPVITDPKMAALGLKWCVDEMERRYQLLANNRAKDIISYNEKVKENPGLEHMTYIVVVIDELADLMMAASNDVEDAIKRLTAKSRACGIHLLVATQRPTTDVVNGTIKANIPARFAFRVSSIPDSVTILNQMGAEALLGRGDMLIKENDNPYRVQGAYVSDDEIENVIDFIRNQAGPDYLFEQSALLENSSEGAFGGDELFVQVARFVVSSGSTSINRIQKEYNVGFNRAQKLFEMLKDNGIIASVSNGAKGNISLVTPRELDDMLRNE